MREKSIALKHKADNYIKLMATRHTYPAYSRKQRANIPEVIAKYDIDIHTYTLPEKSTNHR